MQSGINPIQIRRLRRDLDSSHEMSKRMELMLSIAAHIGIEMVYNCVIVETGLKRGVSKMGRIKGGFLRCGSAIASAIALMSASAVFAQATASTTSEARAETDIIVTGTRLRTPVLHSTSQISPVGGAHIPIQRAVPLTELSVK